MIKKFYFVTMLSLFITSTIIVIENSCFNTWLFLICLIFFIMFSIGLFKPNFIFKISHWYIDKNLEDCSDFFIIFFKSCIAFCLFLSTILQLSLR